MLPNKLHSIATRLLTVILLIVVLFSIIDVSANLRSAKAAGTSGIWYVSNSYQPLGVGDLTSVSCPQSTDCFAVGTGSGNPAQPLIIFTNDIGTSWTSQTVPTGVGYLTAISCASASNCVAVGTTSSSTPSSAVITTSNGGMSWTSQTVPTGIAALTAISCASTSNCVAVGTTSSSTPAPTVITTSNGGTSWTSQTLPTGIASLNSISCASTSDCVAVGSGTTYGSAAVITSSNGGTSWTSQTVPSSTNGYINLVAVSCSSVSDCVAVTPSQSASMAYALTTSDGGVTWNQYNLEAKNNSAAQNPNSISCASTSSDCMVVGINTGNSAAITTTDSGTTWSQDNLLSGTVSNISIQTCISITTCFGVITYGTGNDQAFLVTTNSGASWSVATVPSGITDLQFNSCPSSTYCIAYGTNSSSSTVPLFSTNDGQSWNLATFPSGISLYIWSDRCPSSTFCLAYGINSSGSTVLLYSTNDGQSWNLTTSTSGVLASSYACYSTTCAFAGANATSWNIGSLAQPQGAPNITLIAPSTGPSSGGTTVTITGSNFSGATTVNFGLTPATSFVVNSDTSITAVAPSGIGTVDISVITPYGTSATVSSDQFSYVNYTPISPTRVCDTRPVSGTSVISNQCNNGTAGNNGPLGQGETINVNVAGTGPGGTLDNIPANATAVVANITVTNTTQAGGFLTVYPSNLTSVPNASNLNFGPNQSVPNRVIVPIDPTTGDISIYNFNGSTDVIVDVNGYFTGSNATTGYIFSAIAPTRVCYTRSPSGTSIISNQCNNGTAGNNGPLTQGETISVQVANIDNIPANTVAVVLNVTTTNTTNNGGFFTVYPTPTSSTSPPNASDLNWSAGETVANMVVVQVGNNNSINVYNAIGSADLIIDVMGYYTN